MTQTRLAEVLIVVMLLAGFAAPTARAQVYEEDNVRLDGRLSLFARYDDNIYLADNKNEVERREQTGDGEEDDFILEPEALFWLTWDVSESHRIRTTSKTLGEIYFDQSDENLFRQSVSISDRWRWTPRYELLTGFDARWDERRHGAEYLRPDHFHMSPYMRFRTAVTNDDLLSVQYRYEDRDYDGLDNTPFDDYHGHVLTTKWKHEWTENTKSTLEGEYTHRSYDEYDRNADGSIDTDDHEQRNDDIYQLEAALTHALTRSTAVRVAVRGREHDSTSNFVEYDEARVSALLLHRFSVLGGFTGSLYGHYSYRDYDEQLAQEVISAPDSVVNRDEAREDHQYYLQCKVEKQWNDHWSSEVRYAHIRNDSNDDSSEYDDNRVEMGLRYRF